MPEIANRPEVIAFLNASKENPDDDAPRLILADWLEERDDPRGTFLRLECEMASISEYTDRYWDLRKQRNDLWKQHIKAWLGPLNRMGISHWTRPDSSRGLLKLTIERASLLSARILRLADTEQWAWIDTLQTSIGQSGFARRSDSPLLSQVTTLNLSGSRLYPKGVRNLVKSAFFSQIRRLNLGHCEMKDEGLLALLASGATANLHALDLSYNQLTGHSMRALANNPIQLEELSLDLNRCEDGIADLFNSPRASSLRALSLGSITLSDIGLKQLADNAAWVNLTKLDISNCGLSEEDISDLIRATFVIGLTELDISYNQIGPTGLKSLGSVAWPSLTSLNLQRARLGREGIDVLLRSPGLTQQVKAIALDEHLENEEIFPLLAAHPFLSQIRSFRLAVNDENRQSLAKLLRTPHLHQLLTLRLHRTRTRPLDVALITHSGLESLRRLELVGFEYDTTMAKQLVSSTAFPKLQEISLRGNSAPPEAAALLETRFHLVP